MEKLWSKYGKVREKLRRKTNARRPLTTATAMLFEAALGISAGLLMRMQLDYNMQQITSDKSFMKRLKQVRAALL